MTIHERMIPRTEREKDLLKYGRSQERERIIKLLEDNLYFSDWEGIFRKTGGLQVDVQDIIALIKGEK